MKTSCIQLAVLILVLAPITSQAADLVLRDRATDHSPVIRLGDIADISSAHTSEVHDLASTPLMPAPASGTTQYLSVAQVRELLAARGVQLETLKLSGASVVEIGEAIQLPKVVDLPMQKNLQLDVEASVIQAIEQNLLQQSGHSHWRVEFQLSDRDRPRIKALGNTLQARSTRQPRTGRERFFLTDGLGKEVSVLASITEIQSVVVVKRPIERGQLIGIADVELQQREGNLPVGILNDVQLAIGKEARRGFRVDELLQTNQIRAPWQVRRGETVSAIVRTGGIVVRTRAIAKQDGAHGDLISLETIGDKQRIDASVSGPGEVTVYATGGQTTDYAMLGRDSFSK